MDKRFIEFLGNLLLRTAKGQEEMENLNQWFRQGFAGFEELTRMFQNFYGLNQLKVNSIDYKETLEKAQHDFQRNLSEFIRYFNVVPKDEYMELLKKYEALKEEMAAQKETINNLKQLSGEKGFDESEVSKEFQRLIAKQAEQYQAMIKGLGEFFKKTHKKD